MPSKYDDNLKYYIDNNVILRDNEVNQLIIDYPLDNTTTLYRGFHFDTKKEHSDFINSIKSGNLITNQMSSWTRDHRVAEGFAKSKKSYEPNPYLLSAETEANDAGDYMTGYGGVVLKTTATTGVDISKSNYGVESEVILPTGRYKVELVVEPISYRHSVNSSDEFANLIAEYATSPNKKQILKYLISNIHRLSDPKLVDKVFYLYYAKQINAYNDNKLDQLVILERQQTFDSDDDKKLFAHISFIISKDWLKLCSPKLRQLFLSIIKKLTIILKKKLIALNLTGIEEIEITGTVIELNSITSFSSSFDPLRKHFSDLYHSLNARGTKYTPDLKNKIANIMNAISSLSKLK